MADELAASIVAWVSDLLAGEVYDEAHRVGAEAQAAQHFGVPPEVVSEALTHAVVWVGGRRQTWDGLDLGPAPDHPLPLYRDTDGVMRPANELSPEGYRQHCFVSVRVV